MEIKSINREDIKINREQIELNKTKQEKEAELKRIKEKKKEEKVKQLLYEFLSTTIENNKTEIIKSYRSDVSNIASLHGKFRTFIRMKIEEVDGFEKINFKHIIPFNKKPPNEIEKFLLNHYSEIYFYFNYIKDGKAYHGPYLDSKEILDKLKEDIKVWLKTEKITIKNLILVNQSFTGVEYINFYIVSEYDFRTETERLEDEILEMKKIRHSANFLKKLLLSYKIILLKFKQKGAL